LIVFVALASLGARLWWTIWAEDIKAVRYLAVVLIAGAILGGILALWAGCVQAGFGVLSVWGLAAIVVAAIVGATAAFAPGVTYLIWRATGYQRKQEDARQELARRANESLAFFSERILAKCLVVDSNIWMNERYECFFTALRYAARSSGYKIALFGPQFDEICNIKSRRRRRRNGLLFTRTKLDMTKEQRARMAINRIESLQTLGLLTIKPVTINADPRAYADPKILKVLAAASRKGDSICFVSDDKELRIRAREVLRHHSESQILILGGNELLDRCKYVELALEKGLQRRLIGFSSSCPPCEAVGKPAGRNGAKLELAPVSGPVRSGAVQPGSVVSAPPAAGQQCLAAGQEPVEDVFVEVELA
jgi:hypothetical protein